ncbi:MAG: Spore coat-associated protein N [Syntrophomonadaceae bacterium]|nr:Spore coat-associated protein N [Bacillota bacterium]
MKTKMFMSMLVIALAAALVGGATMALFTDTAANAGNTFTAGTVDVEVGAVPAVPVAITNMAPGDTYNGSFTVRNAGTLELRYSVSAAAAGALFGGPTPAVVGGLGDDQNVVLAPGASAAVSFTVALPIGAGNDYQGDVGTVDFTISAVQTANNPLP